MQTNQIVKALIDKINEDKGVLENYEAVYAFDEKKIELPIKKTYVSFSTNENTVSFFEDENKQCCQRTKVKIIAKLFAPPSEKTIDTYTLAELLLEHLLLTNEGIISGYSIGSVRVNDDLKAFELPCTIELLYELCPSYVQPGHPYLPFAEFMCKTHVDDSDIHVTAEEKDYWKAPFVTGTFVGDGEAQQDIIIGFKPKCLFVFGTGTACMGYENGEHSCYFAFSISGKSTKGVAVSDMGFTVKMTSTMTSKNVTAKLNISGQTYNYIAFK